MRAENVVASTSQMPHYTRSDNKRRALVTTTRDTGFPACRGSAQSAEVLILQERGVTLLSTAARSSVNRAKSTRFCRCGFSAITFERVNIFLFGFFHLKDTVNRHNILNLQINQTRNTRVIEKHAKTGFLTFFALAGPAKIEFLS